MELTDNLNIKAFKPLISPAELKEKFPQTDDTAHLVADSRTIIQNILAGTDKRRLVVAGPCSIHDHDAALEYAQRLKKLQDEVKDSVLIVMRTYFEKPRTTLGWKGMLYDPSLDNSYDIEKGFRIARGLLVDIANIGLPAATEFLDPIVPQYLADLVSWSAVGARTTESQIHRQMASGLSMPIGFKNSTDGNLSHAVEAIKASASPHSFMGIDSQGKVIIAETKGNKFGHLVMRGGSTAPNYTSEYVAFARVLLSKAGISNGIIIDCSHANSNKDYKQQRIAFLDVAEQMRQAGTQLAGFMLESFLEEGAQPLDNPKKLKYGVSLTDSCIGWNETKELIRHLADVSS
jgi:3-deoxy-7-phosphoheptulonate synthase